MTQKIICFVLACLVLAFLLSACQDTSLEYSSAEKDELPPVPEIPEDYLYLTADGVYVLYTPTEFGMARMRVISAFPILAENVEVSLGALDLKRDDNYDFFADSGDGNGVVMPFYTYQMFRGKDWSAYAELQFRFEELSPYDENYAQTVQEYEMSRDEFLEDYLLLEKAGKLPFLYSYCLQVFFPEHAEAVESGTITLRAEGREVTCSFGSLQYREQSNRGRSGTALDADPGYGFNTKWANADGLFYEYDGKDVCNFFAKEDVTITNIGVLNDAGSLLDIQLTISEPLENMDEDGNDRQIIASFLWNGSTPVSVSEGQQISVDFVFSSPNLKNIPTGYTQYWVEIEYQDSQNETYYTYHWFPMFVEIYGWDPHAFYLYYNLNVDVMDYFTNYYYKFDGKYLLAGYPGT